MSTSHARDLLSSVTCSISSSSRESKGPSFLALTPTLASQFVSLFPVLCPYQPFSLQQSKGSFKQVSTPPFSQLEQNPSISAKPSMTRAPSLPPTVPLIPSPLTLLQIQWSLCCSHNMWNVFPPKNSVPAVPSVLYTSWTFHVLLPHICETSPREGLCWSSHTPLSLSYAFLGLFGNLSMWFSYIRLFTSPQRTTPSRIHTLEY